MVSDGCLDGIWRESGSCPRAVWKVSVTGQFGTGQFRTGQFGTGQFGTGHSLGDIGDLFDFSTKYKV